MYNYEKLKNKLYSCASHTCICEEEMKDGCWDGLIVEAADAIDNLLQELESIKCKSGENNIGEIEV